MEGDEDAQHIRTGRGRRTEGGGRPLHETMTSSLPLSLLSLDLIFSLFLPMVFPVFAYIIYYNII